ncbi:MAG TPA: hypothetical protein VIX37_14165, partial [Candidatus Sulfotelmatobacter sp.]
DEPVFATDDELLVRTLENGQHYVDRVRLDGSELQRFIPGPIVDLGPLSPDGKWVVAEQPLTAETVILRTFANAVDGSRRVVLCEFCAVQWSPDSKTIYFFFFTGTSKTEKVEQVAAPTLPGSIFPALPPDGVTFDSAPSRWRQPSQPRPVPACTPTRNRWRSGISIGYPCGDGAYQ